MPSGSEAHLADALFDAHRDDPEFGYRFLADEARDAGLVFADRTAWRICRDNGWWSVFGKKRRGKNGKVGSPAHDDLVRRDFTAPAPNQLWLTDLTEHRTREGKLYLCAIKDVWSNRIVGYSMSTGWNPRSPSMPWNRPWLAEDGKVAGCSAAFRPRVAISITETSAGALASPDARLDGPGRLRRRQRRHGILLLAAAEERPQPPAPGTPASSYASRSSPGSNAPTTDAAAKTRSAD